MAMGVQQSMGNARFARMLQPPAKPAPPLAPHDAGHHQHQQQGHAPHHQPGPPQPPAPAKAGTAPHTSHAAAAPRHPAPPSHSGARTLAAVAPGARPAAPSAAIAGGLHSAAAKHKAAPSPRGAMGPAIAALHQRAAVMAHKHSAPEVAVGSAQAAGVKPETEQARGAAALTVANLDAAKPGEVKRDDFRSKLKAAIDAATPKPKTESEADDLMKNGATKASGMMGGELSTQRDAAASPLKSAATEVPKDAIPAPPRTELQPEQTGAPPAPVSAASVVPAPLPAQRLDYSSDRAPTDQVMADAKVTRPQLEKGNEPAFGATVSARSNAEKHEETVQARYRKSEATVQGQAHNAAQAQVAQGLAGMHGMRGLHIGKVAGKQTATAAKNALERQRVTETINGIRDDTRKQVESILGEMEAGAATRFEAGLKQAEKAYADTFEDAKGGIGTWLTTWGDAWEKHIETSLDKARGAYMGAVDVAVDTVAAFVEEKLKAAKQGVAAGRQKVETFVHGLDASVKQFGEEALKTVSADFDGMGSEIDQRRDGLVDKLAEQYKASYDRMSAMEEQLRDENKSLWQRVYDATVGVVKQILAFKDMLLNVLSKAAGVINDIIADPIGFLGNLVAGVMQGLKNFMSNIGTHLLKGLMAWIFGTLEGAGLQLPDSFDLKGIVSIVLQVLGLTYANFRDRAVKIVGEPVVSGLEKAAGVIKIVMTEGVGGLWNFIKEKVADLKSMVLDAIFDFVKEKVIFAGITWIIGLLNPASAFFKACKAIYDIVMFFITRGSQILELVNAVVDSMTAIAKGSIGVAATFVENALAKAIPVAIGFLAGLLGLGDISGTVKKTIDKAQAPVNKAIDWVINTAVKGAKGLLKLIGVGGKKNEKKVPPNMESGEGGKTGERTVEQKRAALHEALLEAEALQRNPKLSDRQIINGLSTIRQSYGLVALSLVVDSEDEVTETVHVEGKINPSDGTAKSKKEKPIAGISFGKRPTFRPSTKEAIPITTGQDRRHIVAWQALNERLKIAINGKTVSEAAALLGKLHVNGKGTYKVSELSIEGVVEAGRAYLLDQFNAEHNLWAGPSEENQDFGRRFAVAKRNVDDAIEQRNQQKFDANIALLELWQDADPTGEKAGFANTVRMTIMLLRRKFRNVMAASGTR